MTRATARDRSGITLIEILISIMIMGIGVISIATLFPLGLIRLRNAQRLTRGAYLVESATADLGARNLMAPLSFNSGSVLPPPYTSTVIFNPLYQTKLSGAYDPLYVDTSSYGADWGGLPTATTSPAGANRFSALAGGAPVNAGLPVAYDPLWRCVTGNYADTVNGTGFEDRFGDGTLFLRSEGGGVTNHARGLQRISNFQATLTGAAVPQGTASATQVLQNNLAVLGTFVSPEDLILQDIKGQYTDPNNTANYLVNPSPLVPDMSNIQGNTQSNQLNLNSANGVVTPFNDWRYSWLFTGMQTDPGSTDVDGEIVICENRPFGVDTFGGNRQVSGETVVEAVWGFTSSKGKMLTASQGYGSLSASRSVYLRWKNTVPDPDVRVGGWIADVTYERVQATATSHFNGLYPAQRCHWYQVGKKSAPADESAGYRSMTVWTTSPLRAMSLLDFTSTPATAVHVEAALIMPSVINVYPRTVYTR